MYKRINVYLAYAVTALIFTFFVLPAPSLAGTEIDQAGKDFHACIDAGDCDNEVYDIIVTGSAPNLQYSNNQVGQVNQRMKFALEELPDFMQPFVELNRGHCIEFGNVAPLNQKCTFYQVAAGEVCTLTDVNNNARTIGDDAGERFYTRFTKTIDFSDRNYHEYLYLDVQVFCSDY